MAREGVECGMAREGVKCGVGREGHMECESAVWGVGERAVLSPDRGGEGGCEP